MRRIQALKNKDGILRGLLFLSLGLFVACGPSKENRPKIEKIQARDPVEVSPEDSLQGKSAWQTRGIQLKPALPAKYNDVSIESLEALRFENPLGHVNMDRRKINFSVDVILGAKRHLVTLKGPLELHPEHKLWISYLSEDSGSTSRGKGWGFGQSRRMSGVAICVDRECRGFFVDIYYRVGKVLKKKQFEGFQGEQEGAPSRGEGSLPRGEEEEETHSPPGSEGPPKFLDQEFLDQEFLDQEFLDHGFLDSEDKLPKEPEVRIGLPPPNWLLQDLENFLKYLTPKPSPQGESSSGDSSQGESSSGDSPQGESSSGDSPQGESSSGDSSQGESSSGDSSQGESSSGDSSQGESSSGDSSQGESSSGDSPQGESSSGDSSQGESSSGDSSQGESSSGDSPQGESSSGDSPQEKKNSPPQESGGSIGLGNMPLPVPRPKPPAQGLAPGARDSFSDPIETAEKLAQNTLDFLKPFINVDAYEQQDPTKGAPYEVQLEAPGFAVGSYSRGSLRRAKALPRNRTNEGYKIVYPERKRNYGTGLLVHMILDTSQLIQDHYSENLYISDLSLRKGGKVGSHRSHQNGLDVDIAYLGMGKFESALKRYKCIHRFREGKAKTYTSSQACNKGYSVVGGEVSEKFKRWIPQNIDYFRLLTASGMVQWIFVNSVVKKAFCQWARKESLLDDPDVKAVLSRLKKWPGHHRHFHLRLFCPKTHPLCKQQINRSSAPMDQSGC